MTELVPTAKAQRWDPAEVIRVLLAEEAAGRDQANLRTRRKRAAFPAGKTFGDWDEQASSIPRPTQDALKTLEWIGFRCSKPPDGIAMPYIDLARLWRRVGRLGRERTRIRPSERPLASGNPRHRLCNNCIN